MRATLDAIPEDVTKVFLIFTKSLRLVDHSTCTYFTSLADDLKSSGKEVKLTGFDELTACAKDSNQFKI